MDGALTTTGVAFKYSIPQACNAQAISAYVASYGSYGSTAPVNMVAGIWADNSGAPGALLAKSSVVSVGVTPGWVNFPINYSFSSSGTYWLGLISSGSYKYWYDAGSSNQRAMNFGNVSYPTVPNPFSPTSWAYGNYQGSIYLTYTPT
jgi:hypothetical protein